MLSRDNPASDVRGANAAGGPWRSVLVRTGVFHGSGNDRGVPPPARDLATPQKYIMLAQLGSNGGMHTAHCKAAGGFFTHMSEPINVPNVHIRPGAC